MTFKSWCIDLWLDIRWGRWTVKRHRHPDSIMFGGSGGVKRWEYFAFHWRHGLEVQCDSKRDAEGLCASMNDLRGTKKGGLITRL